ncbi:MAG: acyl-CoA dehydrogenase [Desulfomonile tiedjei]|nr:acyl-CoA dehydrogenase [Desulfomonile tiedjei]
MANLLVDERDVKFVLYEQLNIEKLAERDRFSECSRDMFDMVLDTAQKLAENELWPANSDGDTQGVSLIEGNVKVPESFHRLYRLYCEGGWALLAMDPQYGGQGFPVVLHCAATEQFVAANIAFTTYLTLTLGAARLVEAYGTEDQQHTYLDKMLSGEWAGTMCLTEPQAGSDVGALRTRADRNPDGTYSIVGNKIFITSGDHDLTENIVHMVLARVAGAPPGTKGISIFIVPKRRPENGAMVDNDVITAAVEKKLGLHGSATCALNFGEKGHCIGYLLGQENQGMQIMFQMMNEARISVGLQGLAVSSAAYMHALRYAEERVQGPHISTMRDPAAPKVPIIEHPDVRRMLLWMKSVTEGIRSLLYYCAYCVDRSRSALTTEEAALWLGFVDLLIPVCKAWSTDMGFKVTELAVQIHGGYGYCREYPVEQFLRDIKITSIYEGTNGIQALDLVGRKLTVNQGALFRAFVDETEKLLIAVKPNVHLSRITALFSEARAHLIEVTGYFAQKGLSGDIMTPVLNATPYLELFGDVAVGAMLLWQASVASKKIGDLYVAAGADNTEKKARLHVINREAGFYWGKIASAHFFANAVLSLSGGKARAIVSGERSALDIPKESFVRW